VVRESGPDHEKTFEVRLSVSDFLTTYGTGKSKKAAEQAAACLALEQVRQETE
jgi:ribonuclease-3